MTKTTKGPAWQETIGPEEERRFAGYAQEMGDLQRQRSEELGSGRALHRKTHGGLAGTLTVPGDPADPPPFATARTYPVYLRYSSGGSARERDGTPGIRGLAMKMVGVEGKKVLGDAVTQDFLMIHRPVQPFRDPDEFMRFVRLSTEGSPRTLPLRIPLRFGLVRGFQLLKGFAAVTRPPCPSCVTAQWWSAAPIGWGQTAVRTSLIPVDPPEPATPVPEGDDHYAADLAARLKVGPVRFDLAVQTWVDPESTPIEDTSVDWPSPYRVIGRVEVPAQDLASPRSQAISAFVERLSFDPWHAVEELRPLGAMMRARKYAYYASTIGRGASKEPDGTETFPE